jgi:N-acyl-D-amino-acid deacylase
MKEAIAAIEKARAEGVDVNFDIYPYMATGSVLYTLLPDWVSEGGRSMMLARLKNLETRKRVIEEMKNGKHDYSKIVVSISALDKNLNRKKITEIAKAQEITVEDAILDLLIASEGRVVTMMEVLSQENVDKGIKSPFSMISSNGSGYQKEHEKT